MTTQELLSQLLAQVQDDPNLNDEAKDSTIELINVVIADPSADNLKALAIVLEQIGDATQYLSALETIKNLEAANSVTETPVAETPPSSTPPVTPQ